MRSATDRLVRTSGQEQVIVIARQGRPSSLAGDDEVGLPPARWGSKYDDDPASHYSWDSTVPNHLKVRAGDVILLWNEVESLGASVIERITQGTAVKRRGRCVNTKCRTTNYEPRKTMRPTFRCYACG